MKKIYTIPFGYSFIDTLAQTLSQETMPFFKTQSPLERSTIQLLLPTNRSILGLKEIYKQKSFEQAIIMPEMHSFSSLVALNPWQIPKLFTLPPVCTKIQVLSFIMDELPRHFHNHKKIKLALYLCDLYDQCMIAQIDMQNLETYLASSTSAQIPNHVIEAMDFLKILTQKLPQLLKDKNIITEAMRSVVGTHEVIDFLNQASFEKPIIIAGTTGTVPATQKLIQTIYGMENGFVILPGCDPCLLAPQNSTRIQNHLTHPQHTLLNLCKGLGVCIDDIAILKPQEIPALTHANERFLLTRHLFERPPLTVNTYFHPPQLIECSNTFEEARLISNIVKEQLLTTHHDIVIVTPNQTLTMQLLVELSQKGIPVNLSSGEPLAAAPVGVLIRLFATFLKEPQRENFIHLVKHPLVFKNVRGLHLLVMRNFEYKMRQDQQTWDFYRAEHPDTASHEFSVLNFLQTCLAQRKVCHTFNAFIDFFKNSLMALSQQSLFDKEDGACANIFFEQITQTRFTFLKDYEDALTLLLDLAPPVHDTRGLGARVRILGTLEARLNTAQCIICASLNEDSWPQKPQTDPYLSHAMRLQMGLPAYKRQQGLAAHDFCSSFYAKHLFVTRSLRQGSEMTTPSRLWTRLKQSVEPQHIAMPPSFACQPTLLRPIALPCPRPALALRPTVFYTSHLENLMNDPYGYYVKHILKLKPLTPLKYILTARDKGTLFHSILDAYLKTPHDLTTDTLLNFAKPYFFDTSQEHNTHLKQTFWWNRFKKIAQWWHHKLDTEPAKFRETEVSGLYEMKIGKQTFTLKSRADRVEANLETHTLRIIDYKTGQLPTQTAIQKGKAIQLIIEAIIAEHKGFKNFIPFFESIVCEYWRLTGANPAGECLVFELSQKNIAAQEEALCQMLLYFSDEQTPYVSQPIFKDDEIFCRKEEWAG